MSLSRLPTIGSDHPAFLQMGFQWNEPVNRSERLRSVTLPNGFGLRPTARSEIIDIVDVDGYPRALVRVPSDSSSRDSISPVRRFNVDVEQVSGGWKMMIREWDQIVIRGSVFSSSADAVLNARSWLDAKRPGWESYVSKVNFSGKPPRWNRSQ